MIDFSQVRTLIYFPHKMERRREPVIIYVLERRGEDWKGNTDMEELLSGRFALYALRRCQPYSDSLWSACQRWMEKRQALEEEFKAMMEKGVWNEP